MTDAKNTKPLRFDTYIPAKVDPAILAARKRLESRKGRRDRRLHDKKRNVYITVWT